MRARDYSDLRTRKVLSKLDELLSEAANGDAKSQSMILGEARSFLSEQLGRQDENGAGGVAGAGYSCGENIPLEEQVLLFMLKCN